MGTAELSCRPVTTANLDDLVELFGDRGASGGCWCMYWRVTRAEFERNGNAGNRAAMLDRVRQGEVPGILAYQDGTPVGWCSVAPRETFGPLERSPKYRRLDRQPVWSITCFYIHRAGRRQGVGTALLRGAVEHVRACGGRIVEGYPAPAASEAAYMGTVSLFAAAGFRLGGGDPARNPVYRYDIAG